MNSHKGARLTPHSRALLVRCITEGGLRVEEAAYAAGARKATPGCSTALHGRRTAHTRHRRRWSSTWRASGAHAATYRHIAREHAVAVSAVGRWMQRLGLNCLAARDPEVPIRRYEHETAGDLLHLDIKRLGRFRRPGHRVTGSPQRGTSRGAGWEYGHVAIDDHSRVAHVTLWPDESARSAVRALVASLHYYRALGVRFTRVLTDNGACYRSRVFRRALRRLGLRHARTRPYTPRTNGKAERFIQTALREWAYARSYDTSTQRALHLNPWLHEYNWHRPHASLNYVAPMSRIPLALNNLLGLHS